MSNAKIGKLARTGAMWTTGTNIGFWVVFTITSMVLARYLSPEEFGLMALANLTLVFVHTLLEFGLSYAFIQEKEVDQTDASTFFYLQVGINILIWLGISLSAPFVAAYYQQPVLKTLLPIFGFGYVLDALSQVPMTMMARELNYKRNSLVRFAAAVVGSAVCIVMAVLGFGIWSMVADYLVNVGTVLLIVMFWYDWRPSLIFRMNSARRLLNFGKWMLLKSLLRYVAKNLDYILVSRILGLGALGYYERAFNLMRTPQRLISNAVGGVLFSSFSRIQEEHERLRLAFRKVMLTIAVVSYPILVGMMLLTEEFILVIYGDAWTATITPLRIMCLAGIFVSFDPLLSSVLTSAGFVKYSAYRQIFEVALLAVACYIGSFWGITGVAWATVVLSVAVVLIMMQLLKKMSRIGWRDYLQPQTGALIAGTVMSIVVLLARWLWQRFLPYEPFSGLFVLTGLGALTYTGTLLQLNFPELADIKTEIREGAAKVLGKLAGKGRRGKEGDPE